MHLVNHSTIPDSVIQPILDMVAADFRYAHKAVIYAHTQYSYSQPSIYGVAYKFAPAPFDRFQKHGKDSLIVLSFPQRSCYPFDTQHVREVPTMTINNFEEELVLVLAHELRHVDQFFLGTITEHNRYEAEIDAEKHAIATLLKYRRLLVNQRRAA